MSLRLASSISQSPDPGPGDQFQGGAFIHALGIGGRDGRDIEGEPEQSDINGSWEIVGVTLAVEVAKLYQKEFSGDILISGRGAGGRPQGRRLTVGVHRTARSGNSSCIANINIAIKRDGAFFAYVQAAVANAPIAIGIKRCKGNCSPPSYCIYRSQYRNRPFR